MLDHLEQVLIDLAHAHHVSVRDIGLIGAAAIVLAGILIRTVSGDRLENDWLAKLGWLVTLIGAGVFIYVIWRRHHP